MQTTVRKPRPQLGKIVLPARVRRHASPEVIFPAMGNSMGGMTAPQIAGRAGLQPSQAKAMKIRTKIAELEESDV